jgi:hypothetical protein
MGNNSGRKLSKGLNKNRSWRKEKLSFIHHDFQAQQSDQNVKLTSTSFHSISPTNSIGVQAVG